jgi:hypothetical protein
MDAAPIAIARLVNFRRVLEDLPGMTTPEGVPSDSFRRRNRALQSKSRLYSRTA